VRIRTKWIRMWIKILCMRVWVRTCGCGYCFVYLHRTVVMRSSQHSVSCDFSNNARTNLRPSIGSLKWHIKQLHNTATRAVNFSCAICGVLLSSVYSLLRTFIT